MNIKTNSREELTGEEIRWAYRKWCEGRPQHQIAEALNVSQSALCQTFIRHGLKRQLVPLKYERGEGQMTDRERLIKIVSGKPCMKPCTEDCQYLTADGCDVPALVADYLIANGVTFATDNHVGDKMNT